MPDSSPRASRAGRPARRWLLVLLVTVLSAGLAAAVAGTAEPADATTAQSGGFVTKAVAKPTVVLRGQTVAVTATVTASSNRSALVDLEIANSSGVKVFQKAWDAQSFRAGVTRTFRVSWVVPADEALSAHAVRVGLFSNGWGTLYHWNGDATSFAVTSTSPTTTAPPTTVAPTTRPPVTTTTARASTTTPPTTTSTPPPTTAPPTTAPPTTAPPTTAPNGTRFVTLSPGAALPSDAACASRVRKAAEVRPENAVANNTRGFGSPTNPPFVLYKRVTGNFTGTTDEIIQWSACKWGFDEDVVRAQTAVESWWTQSSVGDNGESFGLQQVRQPYWGWAFNNGVGDAKSSSAFNMDAAMAARRNCFEGAETWLGGSYAKGDLWGCVGLWFSGRWHDQASEQYISTVKSYLSQRVWANANFTS